MSWPILFGTILWQLWKDRCDLVINNRTLILDAFAVMTLSLAPQVTSALLRPDKPYHPPELSNWLDGSILSLVCGRSILMALSFSLPFELLVEV